MSSDYYWMLWLKVMQKIENVVSLDMGFQESKAHDQRQCDAAQRLTGMLGAYYSIYNEALECLHMNFQMQKTVYIGSIVKNIVARILELKHQIQKLESTNMQFFGNTLAAHQITTYDIELADIPKTLERPDAIKKIVDDAFQKAIEKKEELQRLAEEENRLAEVDPDDKKGNWWDTNEEEKESEKSSETSEVVDEETLKIRELGNMIKAQEKTRQVYKIMKQSTEKRAMWKKELLGTLQPQTRHDIKERAAKLLQIVFRKHFELKRQRIKDCKIDKLLGARLCQIPIKLEEEKLENLKQNRRLLVKEHEKDWQNFCAKLRQDYFKRKGDEIADDVRDEIRDWFMKWYKEVKYLYDIPKTEKGGSVLIVDDDIIAPSDWIEEYTKFAAEKKANKNKAGLQKEYEKKQAMADEANRKKEEKLKQKNEEALLKKMMKNPNLHPGYTYPKSTKCGPLLESINNYQMKWKNLDKLGNIDVKKRSVREYDVDDICYEVKLEVRKTADEDMRTELKLLRKALKLEYNRIGKIMPENMTPEKRTKAKKLKAAKSENLFEKMEDLILKDIVLDYPKIRFENFQGDNNFAADEQRCSFVLPQPYNGELRKLWWDHARTLIQGFHRIVLVGPRGSGKSILVHAMASANDAILMELDPAKLPSDKLTDGRYLNHIVTTVVSAARSTQPTLIFIKNVHKFFCKKKPPEEKNMNYNVLKKYFTGKLLKKINNTDKITIVASCCKPWLTKEKPMLKKFPSVVLMPNTNYTTVLQLLNEWVLSNNCLPKDFDVHTLAYVLQGYSYGFIKHSLDKFLNADRTIRIAARGLSPREVYDYFLENEDETKVEYSAYLDWYRTKTHWGRAEVKAHEEQLEFKVNLERYAEKMEKKKQKEGIRNL